MGPSEGGIVPAQGAVAALIEKASGVKAFFVGKPNPLMMRLALNLIGAHSENTVMVGDRMDTDIIGGVQTGMETILVLSGVTHAGDVSRFPPLPHEGRGVRGGHHAVKAAAVRRTPLSGNRRLGNRRRQRCLDQDLGRLLRRDLVRQNPDPPRARLGRSGVERSPGAAIVELNCRPAACAVGETVRWIR